MSPISTFAVAQLRQLIFYHLDNESLDSASFLAGRLHAIDPRNPDASHLLALTSYRARRPKAAYDAAHKHGANGKHLGCAFIFALACQDLEKYNEGIVALEKARSLWQGRSNWGKHSDSSRRHTPDAAAVNSLLGRLWRAHGDSRRAADFYVDTHQANPFTWEAFQALCDMGADIDLAHSFKSTTDMANALSVSEDPSQNEDPDAIATGSGLLPSQLNFNQSNVLTPSNDPFNAPTRPAVDALPSSFMLAKMKTKSIFSNGSKEVVSTWDTPTSKPNSDTDVEMGGVQSEPAVSFDQPPAAPQRRTAKSTLQRLGLDANRDGSRMRAPQMRGHLRSESTDNDEGTAGARARQSQPNHKRTISGHASQDKVASNLEADGNISQPRRSNRLFSQITGSRTNTSRLPSDTSSLVAPKRDDAKKAKATGTRGRGTSTVGRVVSGNRKVMPPNPNDKEPRAPSRNTAGAPPMPQKPPADVVAEQDVAALESLLASFRSLGIAYHALSRYEVATAIDAFKALPVAHRETPWVLAQLGKAHYEAADYAAAESCFARLMKLQPSRIEDTEVYSNVLWQLKKPVQLAFLSHTLRDLDFNAPQTWCALGNAFSLSREHEQAISCFKRATQVDPRFSYAWTLMGHELLTNEEFDAALASFRKGIGNERRAYGAWYGLGKCYERMGKWEEAERHYRVAASINPSNSVLAVCVGVILEKLRRPKQALTQYTHALTLAPNSSLAHFKKARVLLNLKLYAEALVQLEALKNLAAEEANVWFLLGKCHKALGQRAASVRAYTTALNLDPKAAQYIKEAMESLDDSEDDMDDE